MVLSQRFNVWVLMVWSLFVLSAVLGKSSDENICKSDKYAKETLKVLNEQTITGSYIDRSSFSATSKVPSKFEASDVILRSDGQMMYVVFDNMFHIGAFCADADIPMSKCRDQLLQWPDPAVQQLESQFEGIAYNSLQDMYYVVQEAIPTVGNKKKFQPNIFGIRIGNNDSNPNIQIIESCRVDMEFDKDGKGFEGLEFTFSQTRGKIYLFGLCEANKCASSVPDKISDVDLGEGRLVVLEKQEATKKNPCSWTVVDKIKLPSSIQFVDYSAISIYRKDFSTFPTYVAITSQMNSQVWIGLIEEITKSPFFQITSFDKDVSYNLPRATEISDQCSIKYCNIEGVTWRDKNQLILVSDKSKATQDGICNEKDQSIHCMALP